MNFVPSAGAKERMGSRSLYAVSGSESSDSD